MNSKTPDSKVFQSQTGLKQPLIAAFRIEAATQAYFNELRSKHFPSERNYIDAHLTLFHALPDEPWIKEDLKQIADSKQPFEAEAVSIVSLGYGTAFKIVSAELSNIHQTLQNKWWDHLTNQDKQKRNFHITVQNKVSVAAASELKDTLNRDFNAFSFQVLGIELYRYLDGPWEFVSQFDLGKNQSATQNPDSV
jgi:2'-5' RNA ligase